MSTRRGPRAPSEPSGAGCIAVAIYAFSASSPCSPLRSALSARSTGSGPSGVILPQGAMFGVICVLCVVADRVPVELHFRGNTHAFVLEDGAAALRTGRSSPPTSWSSAQLCAVSSLSPSCASSHPMKVAFNVASLRFATAIAADRLPGAPGNAQSGQPPRLGRRGGGR